MVGGSDHMQGRVFGGFEIIEPLGAGGMGSVYRARDVSLERDVALKILSPGLGMDPLGVERFQQEAKTLASLRHPNLMHIYSVGKEDGIYYFAMEYIEGMSLARMLSRKKNLSLDEAMKITSHVMSALFKVHRAGVVHRDLKPGNIMIDGDGRAVLVDFGLSKDTSSKGLTTTGSILGTPEYMAPEQIEGGEVGPHTDIYSLGTMVYAMLAGESPFRRKSAIQSMRAHFDERPALLLSVCSELPPLLSKIVARAMSLDVSGRYSDVCEMAADLVHVSDEAGFRELAGNAAGSEGETVVGASPSSLSEVTVPLVASGKAGTVAVGKSVPVKKSRKPNPGKAKPRAAASMSKMARSGAAPKPSNRMWLYASIFAGLFLFGLLVGLVVMRRNRNGGIAPKPPVRASDRQKVELYKPSGVESLPVVVEHPKIRLVMIDGRRIDGTLLGMKDDKIEIESHPGKEVKVFAFHSVKIVVPIEEFAAVSSPPPVGRRMLRDAEGGADMRRRPRYNRTPR